MLPTLVIGLREGLEAALIVGILAAYLKRREASLVPMWIGVALAIALSIAVGVGLELLAASLPQAEQEGLESIIGTVAVIFVTAMIVWMGTHSRGLKKEIEREAGDALGRGTAMALAVMAFLAVLKEGFETSVFLLATFQASSSAVAAGAGAVVGVVVAIGIGIGIYYGGVKLNLSKFFRVTGVFLVFVAAGLVLTVLRTAHEAGWVLIGQQRTIDLSWLAPPGSIQAALVTGVLGVPADPRTIEVLGWAIYLVVVLTYVLWPAQHRPAGWAVPRLRLLIAGALVVTASALAIAVPSVPSPDGAASMPVSSSGGTSVGSVTIVDGVVSYPSDGGATQTLQGTKTADDHNGIDAIAHTASATATATGTKLTLQQLVELSGGRLPIGMSALQNPGPFSTDSTTTTTTTVWTVGDGILDATQQATSVIAISGGGLTTSRTITVDSGWTADAATVSRVASQVAALHSSAQERLLWKLVLPIALAIAAVALLILAVRDVLRLRRRDASPPEGDAATIPRALVPELSPTR